MKALTRDEIKSVNDSNAVPIQISEWGGTVFVRQLSVGQLESIHDKYESASYVDKIIVMIVACACDENGAALFTDDDIAWLRGKGTKPLLQLARECNRINGLDEDADAIEGNSGRTQSDATGSD